MPKERSQRTSEVRAGEGEASSPDLNLDTSVSAEDIDSSKFVLNEFFRSSPGGQLPAKYTFVRGYSDYLQSTGEEMNSKPIVGERDTAFGSVSRSSPRSGPNKSRSCLLYTSDAADE